MKIYQCDLCGRQVDPTKVTPTKADPCATQALIPTHEVAGCVARKFPKVKEVCRDCVDALDAARKKAEAEIKDPITEAILNAAYMRWSQVPANVVHQKIPSVVEPGDWDDLVGRPAPDELQTFAAPAPHEHDSDCAVYNGPAYPAGECDCSLARNGETSAQMRARYSSKLGLQNPHVAEEKVTITGVDVGGWDEPPCWAGDIDPPSGQGERVIWKYDAPCDICGKAERRGHFHICRGAYTYPVPNELSAFDVSTKPPSGQRVMPGDAVSSKDIDPPIQVGPGRPIK